MMTTLTSIRRARYDAVVLHNQPICREHYRLRLAISPQQVFPPTQPGQFIQIGCRPPNGAMDPDQLSGQCLAWEDGQLPQLSQPELREPLALLRRPFSLSGRGDDDNGTWIEIIHRVVGIGTDWLAGLQTGDAVDLIGPLGNAFTLPAGKRLGLLVGGGVGLPPMFYLAQALKQADWQAVGFVGAMTRDLLAVTFDPQIAIDATGTPAPSVREFAQHGYPAVVCTDDGSLGLAGRITQGLERYLASLTPQQADEAVVFTCGPEPMMHAVASLAEAHNIACQVCVEQAMACGMSTCQSCVVRIEEHQHPHATTEAGQPWRYRLACTDGPVFEAKEVVW